MAKRARDQDGDSPKKGSFSIKRFLYGAENYSFLPRAIKRLPDPLPNKESYKEWSVHMKNYLSGRDLWNVVENDSIKLGTEVWKKKNGAAFKAILMSCGTEAKDLIQDCSSREHSARDAWNRLADEYDNSDSIPEYQTLYKAIQRGKWEEAKEFLDNHEKALTTGISFMGNTALHVAVSFKHVDIVKSLTGLLSKERSYGDLAWSSEQ